ncbi:Uncharacterised protein [Mycobacteroides abscessus subsp. abscessus]|nr:Uncharacterised protein [Mycobacteroides abscessus subsp. abscessus]
MRCTKSCACGDNLAIAWARSATDVAPRAASSLAFAKRSVAATTASEPATPLRFASATSSTRRAPRRRAEARLSSAFCTPSASRCCSSADLPNDLAASLRASCKFRTASASSKGAERNCSFRSSRLRLASLVTRLSSRVASTTARSASRCLRAASAESFCAAATALNASVTPREPTAIAPKLDATPDRMPGSNRDDCDSATIDWFRAAKAGPSADN